MTLIIFFNLCMFLYINYLMEKKKRMQECNLVEKIFRYRYYLIIPLYWVKTIIDYPIYLTNKKNYDDFFYSPKNLWGLLISEQQLKMKWYYTMDEVKFRIKKIKIKKNK